MLHFRARIAQIRILSLIMSSIAASAIISTGNDDGDHRITLEPGKAAGHLDLGPRRIQPNKSATKFSSRDNLTKIPMMGNYHKYFKDYTDVKDQQGVKGRPNHSQVTSITFGIMLYRFGYLDVKTRNFQADIIWTMAWWDPRIKDLIPKGEKDLTIPLQPCEKDLIWRPRVTVSNYEGGTADWASGVHIGKSGVETYKLQDDGMVHFTRSVSGMFKYPFDITDYPFDKQKIEFVLASSLYMADEIKLQPITDTTNPAFSRVDRRAFENASFEMRRVHVRSVIEHHGPMNVSTGKFTVEVVRHMRSWYQGHLTSMLLLVAMGYSVWFFPLTTFFAMPRVATSSMAYLTMAQTRATYLQTLHGVPGTSWGEYYIQNFVWLQMLSIVLNVFVEHVIYGLKLPDLGSKMNIEIRLLYPTLAAISYVLTGNKITKKVGPTFLGCVAAAYIGIAICRVAQAQTGVVWCCPNPSEQLPTEHELPAEHPNSATNAKPESSTVLGTSGS